MQRYRKLFMIAVGLLCAFGVLTLAHEAFLGRVEAACGVERWSVKVGTDADRSRVNLGAPMANTIATMVRWPHPRTIPNNRRIAPYETTVWSLTATLVKFKLETDEDYHLILADSSGRTMIAEIPAPHCVGSTSPFAAKVANARAQFNARFMATPTLQTANVPVHITGVGFFDFSHGQAGSAPNQIELHPVLDIIFGAGSAPEPPIFFSPAGPPAAPADVTATGGDSQVTLSWSDVPGATSYTVYRIPTNDGESSYQTDLISPTFTDTGVVNGTTYYYVVTALNAAGESEPSPEASATPTSGGNLQLLSNPGFENDTANPLPWVATPGVIDNDSLDEPPHSGAWKAWLNGVGRTHTDTLYQAVSIPATVTSATLSFWLHIDTDETTTTIMHDTLEVQIRDSSGGVLTTLETYSNLDAVPGYSRQSFDLSDYIGQSIQIYLIGREDHQKQTSFVVDDFELNVQ